MLALSISRVGQVSSLQLKNTPVACFRQRKTSQISGRLLCWRYLFSRVGQVSSFCGRGQSGGLFAAKRKPPNFLGGFLCWRYLFSQAVTRQVSSTRLSLTSVFGMGTGGPSSQSTPTSQACILKTEHSQRQIMHKDI